MKKSLLALLAVGTLALGACTSPPTQNEINIITNACNVDAAIRPLVTALAPLANPEEILAVTTARGVIDPICANPAGSVASNTVAVLSSNVATIQTVLGKLQARKAGK